MLLFVLFLFVLIGFFVCVRVIVLILLLLVLFGCIGGLIFSSPSDQLCFGICSVSPGSRLAMLAFLFVASICLRICVFVSVFAPACF